MPEIRVVPVSFNLVDELFDVNRVNLYQLFILAEENRFTCAIYSREAAKFLALQQSNSYDELWQKLPKAKDWSSVTCLIAQPKFTLVPSALFEEESKESLLAFNHDVKGTEEVLVNGLRGLDAKVIFTSPKEQVSEIRRSFQNAAILHAFTPFLEEILMRYKTNSGKKVFANFYPGYFEVAVLDGKELVFSNAFAYKAAQDIAYYLLFIYEQLDLNPDTVELMLSGEIDKTSKEHSLLFTYIRHVKFAGRPEGFSYSYKFQELPAHCFWNLFAAPLITG